MWEIKRVPIDPEARFLEQPLQLEACCSCSLRIPALSPTRMCRGFGCTRSAVSGAFWSGRSEYAARGAAHAREHHLQPPVIHDQDHALVKRASATVTPQAVSFDRRGNIVYSGRIDHQYVDFGVKRRQPTSRDLVNALDAFLAGEEVSSRTTQAIGWYIEDLAPQEHTNRALAVCSDSLAGASAGRRSALCRWHRLVELRVERIPRLG